MPCHRTPTTPIADLFSFRSPLHARAQNRLTSEQSATIVKALAKLPKDFEMIVYPTLITVITDNAAARLVVGREFDVTVCVRWQNAFLWRCPLIVLCFV